MSLSFTSNQVLSPVATAASVPAASTARAADGDFKTSGAGHRVKDSDGDYKATPAVSAAAQSVSPSTQAAITGLKLGG